MPSLLAIFPTGTIVESVYDKSGMVGISLANQTNERQPLISRVHLKEFLRYCVCEEHHEEAEGQAYQAVLSAISAVKK